MFENDGAICTLSTGNGVIFCWTGCVYQRLNVRHFLKTRFTSRRPFVSQKRWWRRMARVVSGPAWQALTRRCIINFSITGSSCGIMIWCLASSGICENCRRPPTTTSFLAWSKCGSNLTMRLFWFTCPLLRSSSISRRKTTLCLFLSHINSDSFNSPADSFPFFGSPRKFDHFRIHAVTRAKRCQVSYLHGNAGMLSWAVARQTMSFTLTDSFFASIRQSSGTAFSTSLTGLWLRGCCNQCEPFHQSLQSLSLDAGIPLVSRSAGFWLPWQNFHWLGATRWWISLNLFATNTFQLELGPLIHASVIRLSDQPYTALTTIRRTWMTESRSLAVIYAARSSSIGKLIRFTSANLDLDVTKSEILLPSLSSAQM